MKITKVSERVMAINGRKVVFDQTIDEFLVLEDRVIVMFDPPDELEDDPNFGRNIFAYDGTGEQLWRIQDSGFTALSHRDHETDVPQPYTGMGVKEDGRVTVFQPIGCEFDLDPDTGKLSNMTPFR